MKKRVRRDRCSTVSFPRIIAERTDSNNEHVNSVKYLIKDILSDKSTMDCFRFRYPRVTVKIYLLSDYVSSKSLDG